MSYIDDSKSGKSVAGRPINCSSTYEGTIKSQELNEMAIQYAKKKLLEKNIKYPCYMGGLTNIELYAKQQLYANEQMRYHQEFMAKYHPRGDNFCQKKDLTQRYLDHATGIYHDIKERGKVKVSD